MKKLLPLLLSIALASVFSSCRKSNVDIKHHSESGHVDDNPVNDPSTTSSSDSTERGEDNPVPAQSSDTVGNNQGSVPPPPQN